MFHVEHPRAVLECGFDPRGLTGDRSIVVKPSKVGEPSLPG
jgi:hypothetical protein